MTKLRYIFLLGISSGLLLLNSSFSQAFVIPTIDASAIAEGVKSNIELVKQSTIIVEATSIAGEINSAIGSAKSTISELGLEDAQKLAEKVKKEKENLEKAKSEYDKYKAEYEAQKKKLEEGKAAYEKHKAAIEQGISDAKEIKSDIENTISTVQQQAQQATSKAVSSGRQAFGGGNTTTTSTAPATSQPQSAAAPQTPNTVQASNSSNTMAQELSDAQAEILELRQQLAQAQAQAGEQTSPTVITNDTTPQELEAAKEEIERLKAELAKYEQASSADDTASPSSEVFRKRPNINTDTQYERQSYLDNDEYAVASVSIIEELSFAQADVSSSDSGDGGLIDLQNIPTGTNAATDEFIVSDDLARYCGFNVNNVDASILKACLEDLIAHRSAPNAQTAAEGNSKYTDIMRDSVSSLASEAIVAKNLAANYQDEVLAKLTDDLGSASTVRDDIAALSQTNNQIQILLNNILKIYASQLYLDSMDKIARYNSRMINPEADTVIKPDSSVE